MEENSNLLFRDQDETPLARVKNGAHYELINIATEKFKRYISKLYFEEKGKAPNNEALISVTSVLRARAEYEGKTIPLSLRVAWRDDSIYYDMTNDTWQCVKITEQGWEIVNEIDTPLFRRYGQISQVQPSNTYESNIFGKFLQLTNVKTENDKILLAVYIMSLFIPGIQHVALQLHGEKGSAKSMLESFIKELVDPARITLLNVHKDRMEFIQQISHNYLIYYDNLDLIPEWLSDEVCRGITGTGGSKRSLFTDDEDFYYNYRRCFGFNGINLTLTKPDALERSIVIELDVIKPEQRKPEENMLETFRELKPQLLGYIFDIISKSLKIKPGLKLTQYPRMADFALWGEAIARAMGYEDLQFIRVYNENIGKQNFASLEYTSLGQVVSKFLYNWYNKEKPSCWYSPMSYFFKEINLVANSTYDTNRKSWPKSTNYFTRRLKPLLSSIRDALGFDITIFQPSVGKHRGVSFVTIELLPQTAQKDNPNREGIDTNREGMKVDTLGDLGVIHAQNDKSRGYQATEGIDRIGGLGSHNIKIANDIASLTILGNYATFDLEYITNPEGSHNLLSASICDSEGNCAMSMLANIS